MNLIPAVESAAALIVGGLLLLVRRHALAAAQGSEHEDLQKRYKKHLILGVLALWLGCGLGLGMLAPPQQAELHVNVFAPRMILLGFEVSSSVVVGWIAMALVTLAALWVRIFVIPKFQEQPEGLQLALERMVGFFGEYTQEKAGFVSEPLSAYMLTIALYLAACAITELFGLRPPTADLVMTGSIALITFGMIQYFGLRHKGVGGRIKSFAKPTPIVFPFKLLSDIATPVSLACRLYGNMLGGMIVMHLVYMALGTFGVGIPAVLGLYFNAFHPLIQVFIFVTLSLTFIGEATE